MLALISGIIVHAFVALFAWLGTSGDVGFLTVSFSRDAWRILSFPVFTVAPDQVLNVNFWPMFALNSVIWGVTFYALLGLLNLRR